MTVGQVIAKLGVDPKEYEKGLKKAEAQADKAGSKIGSIFKNALSVTIGMGIFEALKKGIKSVVGASIDFNSMLQTAQIGFTTMLGSAEKAQKFLEDMADFAVRTPFEYPELLEAAKRMLAYGFAAEEVLPMLRAVGDASAALGSGAVGIDRITLALGQIRAKGKLSAEEMRQLTEAGVPAWHILAEAMGTTVPELQKMVSKGLIPGAKAVDMLTAGMTKRFGGMMASMENTWQGVTSSIKDIWRMTVGTLTQNLFGGLNAMLIKVRDFLSQFYSMINAVMGKKAKQTTDGLVESIQDQAAAITEVGDASEEAAKKADKNLQTFDEVHQLQEEMSDTAAGDMFAIPETGAVAPPEMEDTGESETFTKMQEVFERLADLFDPAIKGFNKLKKATEPIVKNIGEGLKWLWDEVLVPFGSWTISEAVPAFFNLLASALMILNPVLEAFKALGEWLWNNFLQPIASWTGQAFISAINLVSDALRGLGNWISQNKDMVVAGLAGILSGILAYKAITVVPAIVATVKTALAELGAAFGALTSPIGLVAIAIAALVASFVYFYTTNESFRGTVDSILKAIADAAIFLWENALKPLGEFLATVFVEAWNAVSDAAGWLWENILVPFGDFLMWFWQSVLVPIGNVLFDVLAIAFETVADIAKSFWENVLVPLGNALAEMFHPAVEAVSAVLTFLWEKVFVPFGNFISKIFQPIIEALIKVFEILWQNVFKPLAEFVGSAFVAVFDNMFKTIGDIIGGLKNIFIGLMDFITGIFTGDWEKAWEGIKQIFKGVFDAIWSIVKGVVNFIIDAINIVIGGINIVTGTVGDVIGVNLRIPEIPKLATGTNYVPQDMIAYLHEGEAVVPKKYNPAADGGITAETIEQAVYRAFMNALRIMQASARQDDKELVLKIDNTTLARMQLPAIIREGQRQGLNLVVQGV
jgi:tape measure domain-containing protein